MPDVSITRVYLDTEFTSLNRHRCKLISLALVVFEGPELYVELTDTWVESECSEFVRATVLPQLDFQKYGLNAAEAQTALKRWFEQFESVELFTDAPQWDWHLLNALLNIQATAPHVKLGEIPTEIVQCEAIQEVPHHALQDARLLARMIERPSRSNEGENDGAI